jgi:plasmid stabilization system protein ParE
MARVEIKARARADLDRLARFLWEKGEEEAAVRALEKIVEGIELLTSSPRLGRPLGDGTERRELSIPFGTGAYIIHYMLKDESTMVVLRVWHSREQRRG